MIPIFRPMQFSFARKPLAYIISLALWLSPSAARLCQVLWAASAILILIQKMKQLHDQLLSLCFLILPGLRQQGWRSLDTAIGLRTIWHERLAQWTLDNIMKRVVAADRCQCLLSQDYHISDHVSKSLQLWKVICIDLNVHASKKGEK